MFKKIIVFFIIITVVILLSRCNKSLGDVDASLLLDFSLRAVVPSCGLRLLDGCDASCCYCGRPVARLACCVVTLAAAAKEEERHQDIPPRKQ